MKTVSLFSGAGGWVLRSRKFARVFGAIDSPLVLSFVTHGVTHNKKGPTAIAVSPCFKWSGREDLNLRPPAPKAGALARLRHAPIF